jgi:transposase-like protein
MDTPKSKNPKSPATPKAVYLTRDIAEMFGVDPSTVRNWRQTNYGPGPWFKVGAKHAVRAWRVDAWLDELEAAALEGAA